MESELERKLVESIDVIQDWMTASSNLVTEQAPDVVQQLLYSCMIDDLCWICCFIPITIISFLIGRRVNKYSNNICLQDYHSREYYKWDDEKRSSKCLAIFVFLVSFGCSIPILYLLFDIIKILVAPKFYIVEHLANIIN